jgi:hypothetical protein
MTRTVTFGMKRIVTNFIRKSMVEKARVREEPKMKTHLYPQRVSKVKNYKQPNIKALY